MVKPESVVFVHVIDRRAALICSFKCCVMLPQAGASSRRSSVVHGAGKQGSVMPSFAATTQPPSVA